MEEQTGFEKLLTIKEVATMLGVSLATVYRLTLGRKIPFLKVGGQLRFRRLSQPRPCGGRGPCIQSARPRRSAL